MLRLRSTQKQANSTHPPQAADGDVPPTYQPSAIEEEWASTRRKGHICELGTEQVPRAKVWSDYTREVLTPRGKRSRDPTHEEQHLLSKFVKPDGSVSFIEPLTGVVRAASMPHLSGACLPYVLCVAPVPLSTRLPLSFQKWQLCRAKGPPRSRYGRPSLYLML